MYLLSGVCHAMPSAQWINRGAMMFFESFRKCTVEMIDYEASSFVKTKIKKRICRMLKAPGVEKEYRERIRKCLEYEYSIEQVDGLQRDIGADVDRIANRERMSWSRGGRPQRRRQRRRQ